MLFTIKHTAKDVEYNIDGFIERNKDETSETIETTMESSKNKYVGLIFNKLLDGEKIPEKHKR